ncbi:MAG: sugar-transfer associated ATP-grasp domain-containing protein [Candidatus Delongbacteria bacterium]
MNKLRRPLASAWHRVRDAQQHLFYNRRFPVTNARTIRALREFASATDRKEAGQIRHELQVSRDYWRCEPFFYYRYGLYRRDRLLTDEQLRQYVPEYVFFTLYFPLYNASPLANVISNKIACSLLFDSVGIRRAQPVGFSLKGALYDAQMHRVDEAGFLQLVDRQRGRRVFIKPEDGKGGQGVLALDVSESGIMQDSGGGPMKGEDLLRRCQMTDMILERGLVQREEINRIHASSVNTFRIATECVKGRARILYSSLRIGTGSKVVDNFCQDGLVAGVDSLDGHYLPVAFNQWNTTYRSHPESGFVFEGNRVEAWSEISAFVLEAAERLPFYRHLGWDIALSVDGPVAIETNLGWGVDLPHLLFGGLRDMMRFPEPKVLWKTYQQRFSRQGPLPERGEG